MHLDAGGTRFFTSRATLSAMPGFFRALCDGFAPVEVDGDKCIVIDRDGTAFRHVLLHLQGQVPLDALSPGELELLELDARFYELRSCALCSKGQKPWSHVRSFAANVRERQEKDTAGARLTDASTAEGRWEATERG